MTDTRTQQTDEQIAREKAEELQAETFMIGGHEIVGTPEEWLETATAFILAAIKQAKGDSK